MGPFVKTIFKGRPRQSLLESRKNEIRTCVENYCSCKDAWNYSLDNEPKIGGYDCEANYLSRAIFRMLLLNYFGDRAEITEINEPLNYFEIIINNEKSVFHYDVMNSFSPKKIGNYSKTLSRNINEKKYGELIKIYHIIGNISPLPWFQNENIELNGQKLHAAFDERWYFLLQFLQKVWNTFTQKYNMYITFEDYIISTCQQLYYQEVLNDFKNKINDKSSDEISDDELIKWMNDWNDKIKKNKLSILDYKNDTLSNVCDEIVDDLVLIVEYRSKYIVALLRSIMRNSK